MGSRSNLPAEICFIGLELVLCSDGTAAWVLHSTHSETDDSLDRDIESSPPALSQFTGRTVHRMRTHWTDRRSLIEMKRKGRTSSKASRLRRPSDAETKSFFSHIVSDVTIWITATRTSYPGDVRNVPSR